MNDATSRPVLAAALAYAERGWPVFPCREKAETADGGRTFKAKAPYTKNGLKDATTDSAVIREWWLRWPGALIGLPMGVNGLFALDFDPRIDEASGEVFTLDTLKAGLEAQMGVRLPASLGVLTPSDGVHVYLAQPDDGGPEIRNRGNLPRHVDVRGRGGYVIAPPGGIEGIGRYRWLRADASAAIAAAPAELVAILRAPKARASPARAGDASPRPIHPDEAVDAAIRRYGLSALDGECQIIATAASGSRNQALNDGALKIASLVASGAISAAVARPAIEDAARRNPGRDDDAQLHATIESGWSAGLQQPRDLGEIAASARDRVARRGSSSRAVAPHPGYEADGEPSSHSGGSGNNRPVGGVGGGIDEPPGDDSAATAECALLPLTDLGNAERFLRRHGRDFLHVPEWGWLAWDGRRWNRQLADALVQQAVYRTVRSIGDEADWVDLTGEKNEDPGGLDFIVRHKGNEIVWLSDTIGAWGRTSEAAGHLACIARIAQPWLTAQPADFDADPRRINVDNGTLVLMPPTEQFMAEARLRQFDRADRMTKLSPAAYNPKATCPRYDRFLEHVQPQPEMRRFLHVWGGYNLTGDVSAQKLVFNYGLGGNGKSVWVDVVADAVGDYATTVGIETFIDQGRGRKGGDATPDLAALAGRRMVRTSEPEKGSKFADALIKLVTGGEPMKVRELNMPFFEMNVTFKLTISGNHKPQVGTDHGIWRRMQLVPWSVTIPEAERDEALVQKLKAERSGILNHLVTGALEWLTSGLPATEAVLEATRQYQNESDPLGRFLTLCVVPKLGARVQATPFYEVFKAWSLWAGEIGRDGKPWTMKGFAMAMMERGYRKMQSNTIQWLDIELLRDVHDFTDGDGNPVKELSPLLGSKPKDDDDDLP